MNDLVAIEAQRAARPSHDDGFLPLVCNAGEVDVAVNIRRSPMHNHIGYIIAAVFLETTHGVNAMAHHGRGHAEEPDDEVEHMASKVLLSHLVVKSCC